MVSRSRAIVASRSWRKTVPRDTTAATKSSAACQHVSRKLSERLVRVSPENISNTAHGMDQSLGESLFELAPQSAHEDVHHVRPGVESRMPELLEEITLRERSALRLHEVGEQSQFALREIDAAALAMNHARRKVHDDASGLEVLRVARRTRPPCHCVETSKKLGHVEGLAEVIVGPESEAGDSVADGVFCTEDENSRGKPALSQRADHLEPVDVRKHQVDDRGVVGPGTRLVDCLQAESNGIRPVAGLFETFGDEAADAVVVFEDEYSKRPAAAHQDIPRYRLPQTRRTAEVVALSILYPNEAELDAAGIGNDSRSLRLQ